MKKMMFTLAMVMGLGTTVAFADNTNTTETATNTTVSQATDNFTIIELKDLPEAVQDALVKNFPDATPKAAAVSTDEENKTSTYKVTLDDTEGNEFTVLFTAKGELLQ